MATQALETKVLSTWATSDATPAAATPSYVLRKSWAYQFHVVAVLQDATGPSTTIVRDFSVRVNSSGTATVAASGTAVTVGDASLSTAAISADISAVAGSFSVGVTGIAAKSIDWATFTTVYAHKP